MSKKMMKRSLALGALMAFVITGQAWAADVKYGILDNLKNNSGTIVVQGSDTPNYIYEASEKDEVLNKDLDIQVDYRDTETLGKNVAVGAIKVKNGKGISVNGDINYNIIGTRDFTLPGYQKDWFYVVDVYGSGATYSQVGNINVTAENVTNKLYATRALIVDDGASVNFEGDINLTLDNVTGRRIQVVTVSDGSILQHNGNINLYAEKYVDEDHTCDAMAGYWISKNSQTSELNGNVNMTFVNSKLDKNIYGIGVKNATFNHSGDINISFGGKAEEIFGENCNKQPVSPHSIYGYIEGQGNLAGNYIQSNNGKKILTFGAIDSTGKIVPFVSSVDNPLKWSIANFDEIRVLSGSSLVVDTTQAPVRAEDGGSRDFFESDNVEGYVNEDLISFQEGDMNLGDNILAIDDNASVTMQNLNTKGGAIVTLGEGSKLIVDEELGDGAVTFKVESLEGSQVQVGNTEAIHTVETSSDNLGNDVETGLENLKMVVTDESGNSVTSKLIATAGALYDEVTADVVDGKVQNVNKEVASANISVNDMVAIGLMSWRAEMNDMNKRMGELRNANGEHGVWVRMVRGESEYNSVKNQYNQYQLGYDEKLSTDPSWTVGVALSYTDAENNFKEGNGESTNKALSVYGSKLNDDGTFIDLIAKYARLENDFKTFSGMGDAEYDANGYSVSTEFGKRIQQGKGLWIEPQFELTYGTVGSADYVAKNGVKVAQDSMDSLIGRIGFSLGKDIEKGNVYARASYLYDFDGETKAVLNGVEPLENDLGGGWWEIGVGANINLSKATYIYADIEKTFGGEVDTNWQWNLGVRYSF